MPQYKEGQIIRYKPVGGPESNTSESTGTIRGLLVEPGNQAGRNVDSLSYTYLLLQFRKQDKFERHEDLSRRCICYSSTCSITYHRLRNI